MKEDMQEVMQGAMTKGTCCNCCEALCSPIMGNAGLKGKGAVIRK
jgi:hypothetical protein